MCMYLNIRYFIIVILIIYMKTNNYKYLFNLRDYVMENNFSAQTLKYNVRFSLATYISFVIKRRPPYYGKQFIVWNVCARHFFTGQFCFFPSSIQILSQTKRLNDSLLAPFKASIRDIDVSLEPYGSRSRNNASRANEGTRALFPQKSQKFLCLACTLPRREFTQKKCMRALFFSLFLSLFFFSCRSPTCSHERGRVVTWNSSRSIIVVYSSEARWRMKIPRRPIVGPRNRKNLYLRTIEPLPFSFSLWREMRVREGKKIKRKREGERISRPGSRPMEEDATQSHPRRPIKIPFP